MLPEIHTPDKILSPGMVVFRDRVRHNIAAMKARAGQVARLRPHCKTHKMAAVIRMQLEQGIAKHKAATIAEAEMLAECGVQDIVLAYPMVGPNIRRAVQFRSRYPQVRLAVTADDARLIDQLGTAMVNAGTVIDVLLDINPGRDRAGVPPDATAMTLYRQMESHSGLRAAGLHLYDGHQTHPEFSERQSAVEVEWAKVKHLCEQLAAVGISVPAIVCGGTPTFPVYATMNDPLIELSPGTCIFLDAGYSQRYPDLKEFQHAAFLFTRVISRPTSRRVTFDLGTKAVASDPPMGQRVNFPAIPDAVQVLHNEEHLVVETEIADRFRPGDWTLAVPRHICPTSALHASVTVIEEGEIIDEWQVTARDRRLRI